MQIPRTYAAKYHVILMYRVGQPELVPVHSDEEYNDKMKVWSNNEQIIEVRKYQEADVVKRPPSMLQ